MIGKRVKALEISPQAIVSLLIGGRSFTILEGLPDDAKGLCLHHDCLRDRTRLLVESESFPVLQEGDCIEDIALPVIRENFTGR